MSTSRPLTAISLFSGVGGLDFGFEAAGFETVAALEFDAVAARTLSANRRWPVIAGDIHQVSSQDILSTAQIGPGEADVLIGGPPCQPFSKSGYWAEGDSRRLADPRASTLGAYMRVVRDTLPKAFVLENVHGLIFKGKDEGLRYLLSETEEINRSLGVSYRPVWTKLNAVDYGVPQSRERVFLVAARDGRGFSFPKPTHFADGDGDAVWRTAWDALGDLSSSTNEPGTQMGGRWADLLPSIPEGQNYLWHTDRGGGLPLFGWRTRYWSFLLKLAKNRPSWTLQAQPGSAVGPFHWSNRRLTAREMCRLQTFPDWVNFDCGRTDIQRMIGNAVPSLLGEVIGREVARQISGKQAKRPLNLLPPRRDDCPAEERVGVVPVTYRKLIGTHSAHAGEGLGNRARLRHAA